MYVLTMSNETFGQSRYSYKVFGMSVRSEFPIPELPKITRRKADVSIEIGKTPNSLKASEKSDNLWAVGEGEFLFHPPGIARFYAVDGNRILVDPEISVHNADLRSFMLGSCMGALLQQRRKLTLHAGSFVMNGKAYAVCGKSGAGKSTTCALFQNQGAQMLSDDVSVINLDDIDGKASIEPGYPQRRLTQKSATMFGLRASDYAISHSDKGKYVCPIQSNQFCNKATPIGAIFVLNFNPNESPSTCRQLQQTEALAHIRRHIYRRKLLLTKTQKDFFMKIGRIISTVPVFLITRPMHIDSFHEIETLIKKQINNNIMH